MKRGRDMMDIEEAGDYSDNFVVITELVSPLQRQLLEHTILLANTPADTQDPADAARAFRKLRLLESLMDAEKAQNPHYAVTRLFDPEEETEAAAEINGPGQPPGLASRLMHLCGLDALVEELGGDLSEERRDMAAASGELAARRWFHRQVLMSVLPLLPKITRGLLKSLIVSGATLWSKEAVAEVVAWAEELFRRLGH